MTHMNRPRPFSPLASIQERCRTTPPRPHNTTVCGSEGRLRWLQSSRRASLIPPCFHHAPVKLFRPRASHLHAPRALKTDEQRSRRHRSFTASRFPTRSRSRLLGPCSRRVQRTPFRSDTRTKRGGDPVKRTTRSPSIHRKRLSRGTPRLPLRASPQERGGHGRTAQCPKPPHKPKNPLRLGGTRKRSHDDPDRVDLPSAAKAANNCSMRNSGYPQPTGSVVAGNAPECTTPCQGTSC